MCEILREVITLQVGHYSNFIGAHWWNSQEASFVYDKNLSTDIEHDFLFREGYSPGNQESYTPRLLIIDKKGSLGSLKSQGHLYEVNVHAPSTSHALWDGKVDLVYQIPENKNEFLKSLEEEDAKYQAIVDEDKDVCVEQLGEENSEISSKTVKIFNMSKDVKVWSDFLRPHIHPQTIYLLNDAIHYDEQEEGISWGFQGGVSVMKKEETQEEIFDRIRLLAESCGSLQGFHLLCDAHNGMGGVGWIVAQHLQDDYSSKDVFSFVSNPNYKPISSQDLSACVTSIVQCYTELSQLSSFLLPLNLRNHCWNPMSESASFPHLSYMSTNLYESSSLFGAYMDCITVPYRAKNNSIPMCHFGGLITPSQRKVVGGSLAMPVGLSEDSFLYDWLIENNDFDYRSVSGSCSGFNNTISEHRVIRGLNKNILMSGSKILPGGITYANAWTMYEDFLSEQQMGTVLRNTFGINDPLKTTRPFPNFFHEDVNESGFIKTPDHSMLKLSEISSVPVAATISQGDSIGTFLKELYQSVENINVTKIPRLIEEDMDQDSWDDVKENLRNLLEQYGLKVQRGSDDYDTD